MPRLTSLQNAMTGGIDSQQQNVAILQLAWLLYIIGAFIRGRAMIRGRLAMACKDTAPFDVDIVSLALRVMQLQESRQNVSPNTSPKSPEAKLELASVFFIEQFSRIYMNDNIMSMDTFYPRLAEVTGISDLKCLTTILVTKVDI